MADAPASPAPSVPRRPTLVVAVAGTGTEIGKTWVGAALATRLLADGWIVAPRKPAQSFEPGDEGRTDADLLGAAARVAPTEVVPAHRWYATPMAPPMAARVLGREPITMAALVDELAGSWPERRADIGLVELAGGVASPLAEPDPSGDDGAAFLRSVAPDLTVLVADAGLGTINAVRLSLAQLGGAPVALLLNRFDPGVDLHVRNRDWLARDGVRVITSVDALTEAVAGAVPTFCGYCGRPMGDCGGCARTLEPERACRRCGRRIVVQVAPTSVTSRCRVHG